MSTHTAPTQEMSWVAEDLLDTLRDVLGPARCSEQPLPDFATYGDRSITVEDGAGPERVELTAHLGKGDCIISYSAILTDGDLTGRRWRVAGPVWTDCSDAPEDHPTLTHILPLITRLECWYESMEDAHDALEAAGMRVEPIGTDLSVWDDGSTTPYAEAYVEVDPLSGAIRVSGQSAPEVREILYEAGIF